MQHSRFPLPITAPVPGTRYGLTKPRKYSHTGHRERFTGDVKQLTNAMKLTYAGFQAYDQRHKHHLSPCVRKDLPARFVTSETASAASNLKPPHSQPKRLAFDYMIRNPASWPRRWRHGVEVEGDQQAQRSLQGSAQHSPNTTPSDTLQGLTGWQCAPSLFHVIKAHGWRDTPFQLLHERSAKTITRDQA